MMPITKTTCLPGQALAKPSNQLDSREAIAGGIVHDLKNIFASLEIASHLLHQDLGPEPRESLLASVTQAIERGRALVAELRRHCERRPRETIALHLQIVVEAVVRAARSSLTGVGSLETCYETDLPPVEADPDELFSFLFSLVEEIAGRTCDSGVVTIRCRSVAATETDGRAAAKAVELELRHPATSSPPGVRILWHLMTPDQLPVDTGVVQLAANRWSVRLPVADAATSLSVCEPDGAATGTPSPIPVETPAGG